MLMVLPAPPGTFEPVRRPPGTHTLIGGFVQLVQVVEGPMLEMQLSATGLGKDVTVVSDTCSTAEDGWLSITLLSSVAAPYFVEMARAKGKKPTCVASERVLSE